MLLAQKMSSLCRGVLNVKAENVAHMLNVLQHSWLENVMFCQFLQEGCLFVFPPPTVEEPIVQHLF